MKWFIALNHAGHNFDDYADLAKVAIHSAQRFTKLEPHCLYDGPDCAFTQWLQRRNVPILRNRFFLYDRLAQVARQRNDPRVLAIGGGAFLRTELPAIAASAGITDDFVLYTDVDVMFMDDVTTFFATQQPEYFAVASELDPQDFERMNTGVMWMNLRRLRELDEQFRRFIELNLPALALDAWDQTAYRHFFRTREGQPVWDPLPVEYNFKPYWGHHPAAKIVHFHGPKPRHRAILQSDNISADLRGLRELARFSYFEMCDRWEKLLIEANA